MDTIKKICIDTLNAGKRCIIILKSVNLSSPTIMHYWVIVTTLDSNDDQVVLVRLPKPTTNKTEAIKWLDEIKSFDNRIEFRGDGQLSLVSPL
jgi:hypothetical protein